MEYFDPTTGLHYGPTHYDLDTVNVPTSLGLRTRRTFRCVLYGAKQSANQPPLSQLPSWRRQTAAGRFVTFAPASGLPWKGWTRHGIHVLSHVSSKQQLRSRPGSAAREVAARADREGMGRQNDFEICQQNQRSGEKRQPLLERPRRAYRRRHTGRMGMESGIRQNARTRNAKAGGRTRSSMGEVGRHLPFIRHLLSSVCVLLQPAGDTALPKG